MIRYLSKRILHAIITILGISLISFSLLYIFPGDPVELVIRVNTGMEPTPEMIEKYKHEFGLDKPIYIQYINWLSHAIRGDFGTSWSTGEPVMKVILDRLPASMQLFFPTFILSITFAIVLGILSAIYKDRFVDNFCRIISIIGISIPHFWSGLILIWIFAVCLKILPAFGYGTLKHMILPVLTWTLSFMAIKTRFVRSTLLEVMGEDYITTARAKGLSDKDVVIKHAFRNALIPIITYFSLSISHLIIGAVVIEALFAWPGLGSLLVKSVFERDFPVVQALVFISGVLIVTVNLVVDILYAIIDPRIRYEG
ncbi:nickel ABC transporter permease [Methanotorris igneus]|uniref:ABC-type transporter, integral membrane subunit n=1 Tax=Methanotorris igneus (strain DSM 5666 / JCM 11834 / Kol 5) TaxID=880724 RepID=F6BF74_METIK|nr:nickel ABC transporter permease [Methanotorris igneus]AEF96944.1 ABC-type transporter, integral membrane subunit [Methanotorris igneus Kol 5]